MKLRINQTKQHFIPIKDFRALHNLPPTFGLATLQPKQDRVLGSIENAGDALSTVRQRVVAAVPTSVPQTEWLVAKIDGLSMRFKLELQAINYHVGLRQEEIDFAVSGFQEVCNAVAFSIIRARATQTAIPDFDDIYDTWLQDTVQLGGNPQPYAHKGERWKLRAVIHAYGRVGLYVTTPDNAYFVEDRSLACPAEGFMKHLLKSVAIKMVEGTD